MIARLQFQLRQVLYDLTTGLLFRPVLVIAALSTLALLMSRVGLDERTAWLFPGEPAAAQVVLGTIAGSMMTVVSVVYSILLVALSLASMQFSTRILRHFVRDPVSQITLGLFTGTFVYCLLLLRVVHGEPRPFVPALGVSVALALAVVSMGWLVFFIHHIAQTIQANYLVDQLARESEAIVDEVFPRDAAAQPEEPDGWREWPSHAVAATASGYVQLVDVAALAEIASSLDGLCEVLVGVGHFAVEGAPLVTLHARRAPDAAQREAVIGAFDLGPVRTMQDDAEYGVRQIVDIALKAISPAVNDPSTAVTCIDHLARVIARVARRADASRLVVGGDGRTARVLHDAVGFREMLDLAFSQIRQYSRADMAVGLRILRALETIARCTRDPGRRAHIARHARLTEEAVRASFSAEDCGALRERAARIERLLVDGAPA